MLERTWQEEGTFLPGSGILFSSLLSVTQPACRHPPALTHTHSPPSSPSEAYLPMSFNSTPQLAFKTSSSGTLVVNFLVSLVGTPVALSPFRGLTLHHLQRDLNFSQGWAEDCPVHDRMGSPSLLGAGSTPCYP